MPWYQLNNPGAPGTDTSYTETTGPSGCSGDQQICVIQAEEGATGRPDLTPTLINDMLIALNTHQDKADVVYLKS